MTKSQPDMISASGIETAQASSTSYRQDEVRESPPLMLTSPAGSRTVTSRPCFWHQARILTTGDILNSRGTPKNLGLAEVSKLLSVSVSLAPTAIFLAVSTNSAEDDPASKIPEDM